MGELIFLTTKSRCSKTKRNCNNPDSHHIWLQERLPINVLMLILTFLKQAGSSCHVSINCICKELTLQEKWIIYTKVKWNVLQTYVSTCYVWLGVTNANNGISTRATKFVHIFRVLIQPRIAYYTRRLVHYNHPLQLVYCNSWQIISRYSIWRYLVVECSTILNKCFAFGCKNNQVYPKKCSGVLKA